MIVSSTLVPSHACIEQRKKNHRKLCTRSPVKSEQKHARERYQTTDRLLIETEMSLISASLMYSYETWIFMPNLDESEQFTDKTLTLLFQIKWNHQLQKWLGGYIKLLKYTGLPHNSCAIFLKYCRFRIKII